MRVVFFVCYSVMAVWLVVAAGLRVALSLRAGVPLDVLPAITGGLGLLALTIAIPRALRRIRDRPKPLSGELVELPREDPPAGPPTP